MDYLRVRQGVLPPVLIKTLEAKELLESGQCRTVREAVQRVGISRSAFYKYRDGIERPEQGGEQAVVTLSLLLSHKAGVLSRVLQLIAQGSGNVRTINQNPPVKGAAPVTITFETADLNVGLSDLLARLGRVDGVVRVELQQRGAVK